MADPLDLARRAVASPHWRWMRGMRTAADHPFAAPLTVLTVDQDGIPDGWLGVSEHGRLEFQSNYRTTDPWQRIWRKALPDLTDPATLGCVMALLREEWGQPVEVAALVAALEAHHA